MYLIIYLLGSMVTLGIVYTIVREHYEAGKDVTVKDAFMVVFLGVLSWVSIVILAVTFFDEYSEYPVIKGKGKE